MESDKIICLFCASPCMPNFTPVTVDTILVKKEVEFITADTELDDEEDNIKPDDHGDAQHPSFKWAQGQDQAIQSQLKAFLILTKILKVSNEILCQFLQYDNGQGEKVNICASCEEQVDEFYNVLKKISSLECKLDQLRLTLKENIRHSKYLGTGDEFSSICGVIRREVLNNSEEEAFTTQEDEQTVLLTLEPFDNSSEELVQGTTFVDGDQNAHDLSATQPLHAHYDASSLLFLEEEVDADRCLLPDHQPPPVIDSMEPPPASSSSNPAFWNRKMDEYHLPKIKGGYRTISHNYQSLIRKRTRKYAPKRPVKTVDHDLNVQHVEFMDVVEVCEDKSTKETSIKQEADMIVPNDEEPIYSTPSIVVLDGHLKVVEVASDKLKVGSTSSNDIHPTFPSSSNLVNQTRRKASCYHYKCDLCPFETNNKLRMGGHNKYHNIGSGAIPCEHCGQYVIPKKVRRHLTVVHGYPPLKRKRTQKHQPTPVKTGDKKKILTFSASTTTPAPAQRNTMMGNLFSVYDKFYKCEICSFSSTNVMRFRTHMKVHDEGSYSVPCGDCGRFVLANNFRRHQARCHSISNKSRDSAIAAAKRL